MSGWSVEKRFNEDNSEGRGSVITCTAIIYVSDNDNLNKMVAVVTERKRIDLSDLWGKIELGDGSNLGEVWKREEDIMHVFNFQREKKTQKLPWPHILLQLLPHSSTPLHRKQKKTIQNKNPTFLKERSILDSILLPPVFYSNMSF